MTIAQAATAAMAKAAPPLVFKFPADPQLGNFSNTVREPTDPPSWTGMSLHEIYQSAKLLGIPPPEFVLSAPRAEEPDWLREAERAYYSAPPLPMQGRRIDMLTIDELKERVTVKKFDVTNVQIRINGQDFPYAATVRLVDDPEVAQALDASRDATITLKQTSKATMDAMLEALRAGAITTEQAMGALTPHAEPVWNPNASPRGSWFAFPKDTMAAEPVVHANVLEEWNRKGTTAERMADLRSRLQRKRQQRLDNPTPDAVKTEDYLRALDVVCVHCHKVRHLGTIDDAQDGKLAELKCLSCDRPLWPSGFAEAFIALQLTSDFDAFQTMLRAPPERPCPVCGKPGHRPKDHGGWDPTQESGG